MKLWLLQRIGHAEYDTHCGFVVRAQDADAARCEALIEAGIDNYEWSADEWRGCTEPEWGDPDLTTCVELTEAGPIGVVLASFRAG